MYSILTFTIWNTLFINENKTFTGEWVNASPRFALILEGLYILKKLNKILWLLTLFIKGTFVSENYFFPPTGLDFFLGKSTGLDY